MDSRVVYWNRGAERLYGWTRAEARGRDAAKLLYCEPTPEREEARRKVMRDGSWRGELRQVTREGRDLVVASRWTLVRDEAGRPKSQLIINSDVTAQRNLEAQLAQAQRMEAVGMLAGGVAHDFNNLLTIILGYSELVLSSLPADSQTYQRVGEVYRAGQRAANLSRQLLAFSRRQVLAPRVLDLNTLIAETEKMLRRLIGEDISLSTVLEPDLGKVEADPGQVEQVLMNLVVNARDAMPRGGSLTIATRNVVLSPSFAESHVDVRSGPYVAFSVTDTGTGMTSEVKARIFEPFFTTKEVGKGTGLGLSTVYGIVKQSNGFIDVVSEPGQGSAFTVFLPRLVGEPACSQDSSTNPPAPPVGTGTLLLVEDEDEVRVLAGRILRSAGYTVLEARDGEEALCVCMNLPRTLDLVVTDVVMPRMSGPQFAEQVAVLYPGLRLLYTSGYTDDKLVEHGLPPGDVAVLQKPFTPAALTRKVHEVLTRE